MLSLKEKVFLLRMLKRASFRLLFTSKENKATRRQLIEKLEQMIRNETVNQKYL